MTAVRRFRSTVLGGHARGVEFGAEHADQVAANIASYDELFALRGAEYGVDEGAIGEIAPRVGMAALARVDAWAPDLGQEIRGIAEGAALPLEQVATINARTEVLAAVKEAGVSDPGRGECSTIVMLGADGDEPVAMQNWDWYVSWADHWLVWEIPHADGGTTITATEYGIVGKIGFGRHGLGILFNILRHQQDGVGPVGVPVHVISRHLMDTATTVDGAIALARSAGTSASSVLTLVTGNATGKAAACAELWPGGVDVLEPRDGVLYHTNHFLGEQTSPGEAYVPILPDTLTRLEALHRQLDAIGATADAEQVRGALCDHGEGPNSLCCHPDPADPEALRGQTLLTARLNFSDRTLDVHPGNPCSEVGLAAAAVG